LLYKHSSLPESHGTMDLCMCNPNPERMSITVEDGLYERQVLSNVGAVFQICMSSVRQVAYLHPISIIPIAPSHCFAVSFCARNTSTHAHTHTHTLWNTIAFHLLPAQECITALFVSTCKHQVSNAGPSKDKHSSANDHSRERHIEDVKGYFLSAQKPQRARDQTGEWVTRAAANQSQRARGETMAEWTAPVGPPFSNLSMLGSASKYGLCVCVGVRACVLCMYVRIYILSDFL